MTISREALDMAAQVEAFVRETVVPYEQDPRRDHHGAPTDELVMESREKARGAGVLTPHIRPDGSHFNQRETAVIRADSDPHIPDVPLMSSWSKLFIPTSREIPADAEVVSHQLSSRAGYIRQLSAGIYNYLFLAQRSILKITSIVRQEMDGIGAQEMYSPALNPAEVWQESGRWTVMGDNMFRLKDRFGRDLCLGMT
ncbi:hypothetical protein OY671_008709, partial [Metschnikowia pulcherrima]